MFFVHQDPVNTWAAYGVVAEVSRAHRNLLDLINVAQKLLPEAAQVAGTSAILTYVRSEQWDVCIYTYMYA